jgi:hemolysin activation/secretion protein
MGLNYSHYLAPQGGSRSYVTVGLDDKQFNVTQFNGVPLAGQLLRRSVPVSLGYTRRVESDTSVWGFNVEGVANAPTGTGNSLAAYRTEDTRITNVNWSALRGGFNLVSALGGGWLWGLRSQLQISPDALLSGEQFGIGGASSVRGVGERPVSGDRGIGLNFEVTTPELTPGLRAVIFADAGWLANNNPSATKPEFDRLASAGLGIRYVLSNVSFTADYGRVTTGSEIPASTGMTVPRSGDDRLHLNMTARF